MHNAYPNPFNGEVVIPISLEQSQPLLLDIYNTYGEHIKTLKNGMTSAGKARIKWNGLTNNGLNAPSGVYFARCTSIDQIITQKILLMK